MNEPKVADKDTPYWWEDAPTNPLPPQPLSEKLDVLILGAGYAGLSAGLALAREGRSVAAFNTINAAKGLPRVTAGSPAVASGQITPRSPSVR